MFAASKMKPVPYFFKLHFLFSRPQQSNSIRSMYFFKYWTKNSNTKSYIRHIAYGLGGIGISVLIGIIDPNLNVRLKASFATLCNPLTVNAAEKLEVNYKNISARTQFNFLADVVEKTSKSVVYIEINARHPFTGKNFPISNGSGFIVKSNGLILTNAHVVNHYGQVVVKLEDGREFVGTVEFVDSESDLAAVRIKADNLPVLLLGESSKTRPGEFVIAMGNPLTLSHTITAGVVSSTHRQGRELGLHPKSDYIQTDAAINIGNSGGPLINLDGEVIGINTMKVTEGISFAIPSDRATEFLERTEKNQTGKWNLLKKSAEKKHKYLGITMLTLSPVVIKDLKEHNSDFPPSVEHGVLVWRVMLGSPSYESGMKPGDVIIKVNDKVIHSATDVQKLLTKEEILRIVVVRGHKKLEFVVPLVDTLMP